MLNTLRSCHLVFVGIEESLILPHHRRPVLWQVSPYLAGEIDPFKMPASFWMGISAAARDEENALLDEISSSIAFSLTAMERHLLSLSNEYNRELKAALERGTKPTDRFASMETYDLWLAIHAFLLAAGSARDYLAQALAEFVFMKQIEKTGRKKPDSMSQLIKNGKKYGYLDSHSVGIQILKASDQLDGTAWLANLSEFRNVITHRAPITQFARGNFLELIHSGVLSVHNVLQVALPLPSQPRSQSTSPLVDALMLMKFYNQKIAELAFDVGKLMPYSPKVPSLIEEDITSINTI